MISAAILLPVCALATAAATVLHSGGNQSESTPGIKQAMAAAGIHRFQIAGSGMPLALLATLAAGFGQDNLKLAALSLMAGGILGLIVMAASENAKNRWIMEPIRWAAALYILLMTVARFSIKVGQALGRAYVQLPRVPMRHPAMGAVQLGRAGRPEQAPAEEPAAVAPLLDMDLTVKEAAPRPARRGARKQARRPQGQAAGSQPSAGD